MIAVCVLDQEVKAIGALQSYANGVDISGQRSVSFRIALGRRDESHGKRREIWTPEQGIGVGGETRIADEHAAPAIGEFAQRGFMRNRARIHSLDDACVVLAIFGIAAQKLPGDTGAIKIFQHIGGFRRPPVSCSWPAGASALQGPA